MHLPLQITFRHMDPSPGLDALAHELASGLGKASAAIISCQLVLDAPTRHQHHGGQFEARLDVMVPDRIIVIRRTRPLGQSHEDAYAAVREAFRAARRRLQDYERELQGTTDSIRRSAALGAD